MSQVSPTTRYASTRLSLAGTHTTHDARRNKLTSHRVQCEDKVARLANTNTTWDHQFLSPFCLPEYLPVGDPHGTPTSPQTQGGPRPLVC
jgi:hypothetical protein